MAFEIPKAIDVRFAVLRAKPARLLGMSCLLLLAACGSSSIPPQTPQTPSPEALLAGLAGIDVPRGGFPSSALLSRDTSITVDVLHALMADPAVRPPHDVDITAEDGIVVLSGTVANGVVARRAIGIAGTIRGVRAIENRLVIEPSRRADHEIERDVRFALATHPATWAYDVGTSVEAGRVVLDGSVGSWSEQELAIDVAWNVRGVRALDNRIRVLSSERADADISSAVVERLKFDAGLEGRAIRVAVVRGVVHLSGSVANLAELLRAAADARVEGVRLVKTAELTIDASAPAARASPPLAPAGRIEHALRTALEHDARVEARQIAVSFQNGVATLSGSVKSPAMAAAAREDVLNTLGVHRVIDKLEVRPPVKLAKLALEQRIVRRLAAHPYVDLREIQVVAVAGKAHLSGSVATEFERASILSTVSAVLGVVEAVDEITVTRADRGLSPSAAL